MVNNLDSKLENSTISTVSAPDINDDEVEIDLREIFLCFEEKNLADSDGCSDWWMWCRCLYTVYDDSDL